MREPRVDEFMTHSPHTIGQEQPLCVAYRLMREHRIRHLPVLEGPRLVGILSQRDLHFMSTLKDVDPEKLAVSEAMSQDTYAVGPGSSVRKVTADMADRRYGSAVIVDNGRVIGIFTAVDAMRALSLLLSARLVAQQE